MSKKDLISSVYALTTDIPVEILFLFLNVPHPSVDRSVIMIPQRQIVYNITIK